MSRGYEIVPKPDSYDHDDILFFDDDAKHTGHGYRSKRHGTIGLIRCPKCGRENYAMSVATGECAWCGFDANKFVKGDTCEE